VKATATTTPTWASMSSAGSTPTSANSSPTGMTKIINLASFKNTGHGVSMATKNLGYAPSATRAPPPALFLRVCTEVLAAPGSATASSHILDGLRANTTGAHGQRAVRLSPPDPLPRYRPFALDMHGHKVLLAKRREMGIKVSEHPRYTTTFRQAEALGLGVVDPAKMKVVSA